MSERPGTTDATTTGDAEEPLRLGGMALQNGLLVHGPTSWAAAIRSADGTIKVEGGKKLRSGGLVDPIPLVRGVVRMGEMLAVLPLMRRRLPEARLPFEQPAMLVATLATTAIGTGARKSTRISPATAEVIVAALAALPAVTLLRSGRLAHYHGAEHKVIGGYESGGEAVDATKEHERCGSHLVGPLVGTTAVANLLVSRLPGRAKQRASTRAAASLAATGVAIEIFGWMTRNRGRRLERILARPGTELQRVLGTREPSSDELAVGEAALAHLLALEGRAA